MIWKDVKGFEGIYMVSEFGDIKALPHKSIRKLKQGLVEIEFKEKIMKPSNITNKTRYRMIRLSNKNNKAEYTHCLIHRLVYNAFVGDLIDGYIIDHIDSDRNNNHYKNLQQITQMDNIRKYVVSNSKIIDGLKRCSKCDTYKNTSSFYKLPKSKIKDWDTDLWRSNCKDCHKGDTKI